MGQYADRNGNDRVIQLLGQAIQNEDDKAAEAITPGHLVTTNGSGDVIKHATADGKVTPRFALEREEMGKTIDDAYAIGDTVKVGAFHKGQRVNAIIPSGANIAKGASLASNGDGRLKAGTTNPVGFAVRAVNNTAGPGDARICVEVN